MKKPSWGLSISFFILLLAIILLSLLEDEKRNLEQDYDVKISKEENFEEEGTWKNPLNSAELIDDKSIYNEDVDFHVDKMYVTVLPPKSQESVTFEELNINVKPTNNAYISDAYDPVAEIIFQTEKPSDDTILYNAPNATMEIRGQSSRLKPQKSYKVKLFDDTEEWFGFKTINLNKHFSDSLRIRNKISFDYFEMLNDFVSLRTRFVELYIRDLSANIPDKKFRSYGLYTFIEQTNKRFLERHKLDPNGHLYKVESFEFYRYADIIKSKNDIDYDENKFGKILEIRGNDNHEKLIEMLEAVNDYSKDINEVVDIYFDKDNLLSWLAINILFDNYDSNSRNFLLFSPLNSDKWFFIPWDYDKAWNDIEYRGKWEKSLSNYWGMVLFNRFFKDIDNVNALSSKIEELSNIINERNTLELLDSYYSVVKKNVLVSPDIDYLKTTAQKYEDEYYSLAMLTEKNRQYYHESLENPMPFYLDEPSFNNGNYKFTWDPSYDLQGDDLTYNFILCKDFEFNDVVAEYKNLKRTSCNIGKLKPGEYYWKVIVYDSKGNLQQAFDYIFENGDINFSSKKFVVK